MSDHPKFDRSANPGDAVEKIRAERFPEVDRDLMLKFLQLHAGVERPDNLSRQVDEALAAAAREHG